MSLKVPSTNWKDLAETLGVLAILVGLLFVYEELQLSAIIARAELSAESARSLAALDEQERDPEFAVVLAKSKNSPAELTQAEQIQLDSYFHGAVMVYIRERYNYQRGIFEEWTSLIRPTAPRYFGSGYGRAYWSVNKHVYPAELAAAVDEVLTNVDAVEFFDHRDSAILEQLREE